MGVGEEQIGLFFELTFDFVHHFHGSFTDRLGVGKEEGRARGRMSGRGRKGNERVGEKKRIEGR